jgi:hypothetical protein
MARTEYLENEPWHHHWLLREEDPTSLVNTDWLETDQLLQEPGYTNVDEATGIRWTYGGSRYQDFDNAGEYNSIPLIVHRVNTDNWIGSDFHDQPDVLALGCSYTEGLGLPYNFTWHSIAASIADLHINTIGRSGQNAAQQLFGMFGHNKHFAPPKSVWMLTPPLERFWAPVKTDIRETITLNYKPDFRTFPDPTQNTPYMHQPIHGAKNFYPIDLASHSNLVAIETLINYTAAHNIELKLTSWADSCLSTLERLYPQHVMARHDLPWIHKHGFEHPESSKKCDCGLEPQNQYQYDFWNHGADVHPRHRRPHPGFHYHCHVAELFLDRKLSNTDIESIVPFWAGTDIEQQITR